MDEKKGVVAILSDSPTLCTGYRNQATYKKKGGMCIILQMVILEQILII